MIVCICHRVSDRDIAHAARHGCASFDELQDELGVATACGACGDCARETFAAHCTARTEIAGLAAHAGEAGERRIVPIAASHQALAAG
jgi:bacterioferritin-associated ferredoxin